MSVGILLNYRTRRSCEVIWGKVSFLVVSNIIQVVDNLCVLVSGSDVGVGVDAVVVAHEGAAFHTPPHRVLSHSSHHQLQSLQCRLKGGKYKIASYIS